MTLSLSKIAARVGVVAENGDAERLRPALAEDTGPGRISLATSDEYVRRAIEKGASALVVSTDVACPVPCLRSDEPRILFSRVLALFDARPVPPPGIHPSAVVDSTAVVDPTASVGPNAMIGPEVRIGARSRIGASASIESGTSVGEDAVIGPSVVIHHACTLGDRVRVQAGTVIGSEGFGYDWDGSRHVPVPHVGTVIIEDEVDLGANCCVDRAKTGATRIGRGTKIDNLVQIGHGVKIGSHSLVVAQVGIGGSATLGAGVVLAGQVGVADNITIGEGAIVAAQSGVTGNLQGGKTYMGMPTQEAGQMRRVYASLLRLPEVFTRLRAIERRQDGSR